MAFDYTNLYPDTSGNGGYTKSWNYTTVVDSIATCSASGYFNLVASRLGIGDNIVIARVDAFATSARHTLVEYATLYVNGISGGVVTTLPSTTGYATTAYVDAADALKAPIASPTFTGVPAAPTAAPATNTTQVATTAYADAIAALKANVASPTFTGTPAAPTAAIDTNTTQLATTAMVLAQSASATPLINGVAAVGTSTRFARQDHIHPVDTSRQAALTAGQLPGETSTGNASAGNVGEYVETVIASGSAVSILNNTAKDMATLVIPSGGDWELDSVMQYLFPASTSFTAIGASLSLVLNTLDATAGRFCNQITAAVVPGAGATASVVIPPLRFSLAAGTTIHFVGLATFTASTLSMYGIIRARRVR